MRKQPPNAADRLSRLLAMVPYLTARQGVPLADAARHFGLTEDELVADLELLFVCGRPGHMPDDLIEADWESGHVYVGNADDIARPLRLGLDEAVALL
ncbi:MAG: WYL domain-containing protein, partial [Actinomycetes bacterium]